MSAQSALYRSLKESLGPRGARNAVPKCIIKSYQEISRPTTGKRKQRCDAKLRRFRNSTESSSIQQTTLSSRLRFSRPGYHLVLSFHSFSFVSRFPPSISSPSRPFLSLVIFHARLDGAFIVSSERAPPNEMFSRSSRASSGRLSTNNPQRVPRSKVRYTTNGAGSDLESRQRASRPH